MSWSWCVTKYALILTLLTAFLALCVSWMRPEPSRDIGDTHLQGHSFFPTENFVDSWWTGFCSVLAEMDTAVVFVYNHLLTENITFFHHELECRGCPPVPLVSCLPHDNSSVVVRTLYSQEFTVHYGSREICKFTSDLYEYGRYHLNVSQHASDENPQCYFTTDTNTHSTNLPLFVLLGILTALLLIYHGGRGLLSSHYAPLIVGRSFAVSSTASIDSASSNDVLVQTPSRRLRSLDAFRGLTLLLMIFVNTGAGGYAFLEHAPWNGLTIADCLFPFFMFMMGISIFISQRSATNQAVTRTTQLRRILRRSILLFLLGLTVNSINYKSMDELRLPSVLGRFSLSYFIVALVEMIFAKSCQSENSSSVTGFRHHLIDILPYWVNNVIAIVFPLLHILLTLVLPVPACPTGYLGPGGMHDNSRYFNCTGGAAGYIDSMVLGNSHLYQFPTSRWVYNSYPSDPEGILGCLTSIFLVFTGVQAGRIMLLFKEPRDKIIRLAGWGAIYGLSAGCLCGFSKEDGWIPVCKNLWSTSFVFTVACLAMLVFLAFYYIIDVLRIWDGRPFFYPSANSIVVYVGSELLDGLFPFAWSMPNTHSAQLFMAVWTTVIWLFISVWMYLSNISVSL